MYGIAVHSNNHIIFSPLYLQTERKPYLKAAAPKRPPSSRHWWTHSVCWLAAALCWLTHSPNCPWAPWNLQPIWLSACTHISKHCIDWKRGEWVNNSGWPNYSLKMIQLGKSRHQYRQRGMLFLCKLNQCIRLGHYPLARVCEREGDGGYGFALPLKSVWLDQHDEITVKSLVHLVQSSSDLCLSMRLLYLL